MKRGRERKEGKEGGREEEKEGGIETERKESIYIHCI